MLTPQEARAASAAHINELASNAVSGVMGILSHEATKYYTGGVFEVKCSCTVHLIARTTFYGLLTTELERSGWKLMSVEYDPGQVERYGTIVKIREL